MGEAKRRCRCEEPALDDPEGTWCVECDKPIVDVRDREGAWTREESSGRRRRRIQAFTRDAQLHAGRIAQEILDRAQQDGEKVVEMEELADA